MSEAIEVHELTDRPTDYWRAWKKTANVMRLQVRQPTSPPSEDKLRFVCMSDTHSLTPHLKTEVPDGDVFIHAGDFTRAGNPAEVRQFNEWLGKLPHKHKIVIAGNHELCFDPSLRKNSDFASRSGHIGNSLMNLGSKIADREEDNQQPTDRSVKCEDVKKELTNCTYLEDSGTEICGIKVYGTPHQPVYGGWAFNLARGQECLDKWNLIPEDVDVLVTHGPPLGFGDLTCTGVRAGCVELLHSVQRRIRPKYHVYGHIHEGYGVRSDGKILFINASTCDINYIPRNPPVVFDVSLPAGQSRT